MKQPSPAFWKTLGAAALAGILTVSVSAAVIQSVQGRDSAEIAPGVVYQYRDVTTGGGPQKIHTVSFNPSKGAVDMRLALPGAGVRGSKTVLDMARDADTDGRVVAAINGGFYRSALAMGVMMQDGELYASPSKPGSPLNRSEQAALAVDKDGKAFIDGTPAFSASFTAGGQSTAIQHINRFRADGGADNTADAMVLYTSRYAESTKTAGGLEVSLQATGDAIRAGQTVTCKVVSASTAGNSELKPGILVLSATDKAGGPLEKLGIGDTVEVAFSFSDSRWNGVSLAVGGNFQLARDGKLLTLNDDNLFNNRHPRTAVGIKEDGSMLWVTVDGRQKDVSEGLNGKDIGQLLLDEGCQDVINLDGGGSTTMAVKMPGGELAVRNVPANDGGKQRKVANGLLLVRRKGVPAATAATTAATTTAATTAAPTTAKPPTTTATTATATTAATEPPAATAEATAPVTQAAPTAPAATGASTDAFAEPAASGENGGPRVALLAGAGGLIAAGGVFLVLWRRGVFRKQ